jgi:hypothetical protein
VRAVGPDHGIRVLGEHWISYESASGPQHVTQPPSVSPVSVVATRYAVSHEEAAARMVATLDQAGAGPIGDVRPVAR